MAGEANQFTPEQLGAIAKSAEKTVFRSLESIEFIMLSTFSIGTWSEKYFGLKFDDGVGEVLIAEPAYSFWTYFESEIQTT